MKKKLLALTLGLAFTLTSSAAFAMTTQEAKNLADTFVPSDAKYSKLMNLKDEIEFYYYSDTNRYEVEFDRTRNIVKGVSVERLSPSYSPEINISKERAIEILEEHYPDAKLTHISQYNEAHATIYDLEFVFDGGRGEMDILAADGTILEIDLDY
ncbi:MAG: PepSY domain-containing protein [Selenomonadales bacterium]|nr:PepSY domain-containing protein [Selenomonadales bacterium]